VRTCGEFRGVKISGSSVEGEKHDVRHVRSLHTRDGKSFEIWYYGNTKSQKMQSLLKSLFPLTFHNGTGVKLLKLKYTYETQNITNLGIK